MQFATLLVHSVETTEETEKKNENRERSNTKLNIVSHEENEIHWRR